MKQAALQMQALLRTLKAAAEFRRNLYQNKACASRLEIAVEEVVPFTLCG
jgi:hypothetical protein